LDCAKYCPLFVYKMVPENPITGPSWTTIYTGVSCLKHEIFDLFGREVNSSVSAEKRATDIFGNKVNFSRSPASLKYPYLWNHLNSQGIETELVDLPVTYPPAPVNGFLICGRFIPLVSKSTFTFPKSVQNNLPSWYPTIIDWGLHHKEVPQKQKGLGSRIQQIKSCGKYINPLKEIEEMENEKVNIFASLHSNEAQFGFIQFSFVDMLGHLAPEFIHKAYPVVVRLINTVLNKLKPKNILLISDHGFSLEPQPHHTFHGIIGTYGQNFKSLKPSTLFANVDVAPIVLDFFGIKKPKYFDGVSKLQ